VADDCFIAERPETSVDAAMVNHEIDILSAATKVTVPSFAGRRRNRFPSLVPKKAKWSSELLKTGLELKILPCFTVDHFDDRGSAKAPVELSYESIRWSSVDAVSSWRILSR